MNTEKMADNKTIMNEKIKDKKNTMLDNEKEKLKALSEYERYNIAFCKSINKCINLLRNSANGDNFNRQLNYLSDENVSDLKSALNEIEYQRQIIKSNIKKIQDDENN